MEDGGIERRGEGRGQTLRQTAQRPLGSEAGGQDQTYRLSGLSCFEVRLQVDPAPLPQIRPLLGKLGLEKRQAVQKRRGIRRARRGQSGARGRPECGDNPARQQDGGARHKQQEEQLAERPDKSCRMTFQ